jgi:hypothetical protein
MLEEINLNDLIKKFELPSNTKFIGYGIYLPVSSEFLHKHRIIKNNYITEAWCKSPKHAEKFRSLKKAKKIQKVLHHTGIVVWLFDIGEDIIVTTPEKITGIDSNSRSYTP